MVVEYIKRKLMALRMYMYWYGRLRNKGKKNAYIVGTPTHVNIGDSAITLAEIKFIRSNGFKNVIEITLQEYISNRKCIRYMMPRNAVVFLLGGGFMGDLWPAEERWRQKMIEDFSHHHIVVFPQTFYYASDNKSREDMLASVNVYNTKPNLTLVARERSSYEMMKHLYPNCNILLTPDIVLSIGEQKFEIKRKGILVCFRKDKEQLLPDTYEECLICHLKKQGYKVSLTDTLSKVQINVNNRENIVRDKLAEIAGSKLVITDRLHGMVFAAITGTPCIVLSCNHHKVQGTYEWLRDLDYIKFVEDINEVEECVGKLYHKGKCKFSLSDTLFSDLSKLVADLSGGL